MHRDLVGMTALMLAGTLLAQTGKEAEKHTTIGPVKIVTDNYLYHNSVRFPDGVEKEFYHCEGVGALREGRTVFITFDGDGTSMKNCANAVSVRPAKNDHASE